MRAQHRPRGAGRGGGVALDGALHGRREALGAGGGARSPVARSPAREAPLGAGRLVPAAQGHHGKRGLRDTGCRDTAQRDSPRPCDPVSCPHTSRRECLMLRLSVLQPHYVECDSLSHPGTFWTTVPHPPRPPLIKPRHLCLPALTCDLRLQLQDLQSLQPTFPPTFRTTVSRLAPPVATLPCPQSDLGRREPAPRCAPSSPALWGCT